MGHNRQGETTNAGAREAAKKKKTLLSLARDFSIVVSHWGTEAAAAISAVTGNPIAAIISIPDKGRECRLLHLDSLMVQSLHF